MKTPKEKHGFFLSQLPQLPGVYKFFDKEGFLLYVGKAKNLKNRVSSYFNQAQQHSYKTLRLVQQIERIEFVLVDTEFDALLLENNLIKSHQPKYNILLKDDKTYPYLCLTKEPFPKLLVLRQVDKSIGTYFGPFTNVKAMYTLLELFKELFTLRTCSLALTEENIQAQKFKVCLEYHLGNCQGPCVGLQNEETYAKDIAQIQHILKGNIHKVVQYFKQQMQEAAQVLAFEKAEMFKQKMTKLERFQSKSVIVNPNLDDLDAFAIVSDEKMAFVSYLKVVKGAIIYTQNWQIEKKLDEEDVEILQLIIYEIYQKQMLPFNELVSNVDISVEQLAKKYTLPKLGDKKKLVDLAIKNALFLKKEKMDQRNQTLKPTHKEVVLQEMQQIL
ncbi:MAG TPA: excinuclease ABC subunit C, partial [Microscillaceae bacterium]|nr:excinuclease ABC subunit C [Microscillaceae bacterium]